MSRTRHTPWTDARYDVSPKLRLLGDAKAFEFDASFPRLQAARRARPDRALRDRFDAATERATVASLLARLAREWPERVLPQTDGIDALADELPCDLVVVRRRAGRDWNAYLNVAAPSRWRPDEKIGLAFGPAHAPVPGFGRVAAAADALVEAMVARGPWVRFVWSVETDEELDHHPDRAPVRDFARDPFVVRVERQVTLPMPDVDASAFLIGTSFVRREEILEDPALWRPLRAALRGMNPAERAYKGVAEGFDALLAQFPP